MVGLMKFWNDVKENLSNKFKNDNYAKDFYRAMSNMRWQNIKDPENIYSCTWRYAGGMVAEMFEYEHPKCYLDFYCSGNEGYVSDEIENDLKKIPGDYIHISW